MSPHFIWSFGQLKLIWRYWKTDYTCELYIWGDRIQDQSFMYLMTVRKFVYGFGTCVCVNCIISIPNKNRPDIYCSAGFPMNYIPWWSSCVMYCICHLRVGSFDFSSLTALWRFFSVFEKFDMLYFYVLQYSFVHSNILVGPLGKLYLPFLATKP